MLTTQPKDQLIPLQKKQKKSFTNIKRHFSPYYLQRIFDTIACFLSDMILFFDIRL